MRPNLYDNPLLKALVEATEPRIHPLMRSAVLRRDHSICRYCGGFATQVDHVEPSSRGGLTVMGNLVAACGRCNREKGDRTPAEWDAAKQRQAAVKVSLQKRAVTVQKRPLRKARRITPSQPGPTLAQLLQASAAISRRS